MSDDYEPAISTTADASSSYLPADAFANEGVDNVAQQAVAAAEAISQHEQGAAGVAELNSMDAITTTTEEMNGWSTIEAVTTTTTEPSRDDEAAASPPPPGDDDANVNNTVGDDSKDDHEQEEGEDEKKKDDPETTTSPAKNSTAAATDASALDATDQDMQKVREENDDADEVAGETLDHKIKSSDAASMKGDEEDEDDVGANDNIHNGDADGSKQRKQTDEREEEETGTSCMCYWPHCAQLQAALPDGDVWKGLVTISSNCSGPLAASICRNLKIANITTSSATGQQPRKTFAIAKHHWPRVLCRSNAEHHRRWTTALTIQEACKLLHTVDKKDSFKRAGNSDTIYYVQAPNMPPPHMSTATSASKRKAAEVDKEENVDNKEHGGGAATANNDDNDDDDDRDIVPLDREQIKNRNDIIFNLIKENTKLQAKIKRQKEEMSSNTKKLKSLEKRRELVDNPTFLSMSQVLEYLHGGYGGLSRYTLSSDAWHAQHKDAAKELFGYASWQETKDSIGQQFPDLLLQNQQQQRDRDRSGGDPTGGDAAEQQQQQQQPQRGEGEGEGVEQQQQEQGDNDEQPLVAQPQQNNLIMVPLEITQSKKGTLQLPEVSEFEKCLCVKMMDRTGLTKRRAGVLFGCHDRTIARWRKDWCPRWGITQDGLEQSKHKAHLNQAKQTVVKAPPVPGAEPPPPPKKRTASTKKRKAPPPAPLAVKEDEEQQAVAAVLPLPPLLPPLPRHDEHQQQQHIHQQLHHQQHQLQQLHQHHQHQQQHPLAVENDFPQIHEHHNQDMVLQLQHQQQQQEQAQAAALEELAHQQYHQYYLQQQQQQHHQQQQQHHQHHQQQQDASNAAAAMAMVTAAAAAGLPPPIVNYNGSPNNNNANSKRRRTTTTTLPLSRHYM